MHRKVLLSLIQENLFFCLGLPTVIYEKGILKMINLTLSEAKETKLRNSAQVLWEIFAQLKL